MTGLNQAARNVLRAAGITGTQWARANFASDGVWTGDPCGCPDSGRCMNGFHHYPADECGCLRALLEQYLDGKGFFAEWPPALAAKLLARDLLQLVDVAGMPDTIWQTDSRVALARTVLDVPGDGRYSHAHLWAAPEGS